MYRTTTLAMVDELRAAHEIFSLKITQIEKKVHIIKTHTAENIELSDFFFLRNTNTHNQIKYADQSINIKCRYLMCFQLPDYTLDCLLV